MSAIPLVSICCLTYNHAPFIRDCLEGILAQQTDFPIEILIHDDASTDGTDAIIRQYEQRYPNVVFPIYEKENQFNRGYAYKMDIEFNYTKGTTRDKQMSAYIFEIFFKEAIQTEKYKDMKKIIQIMIENYDYFHEGKFIYEVGFMEKELGIPEDNLITKYHISLASLKNMDYNSLSNIIQKTILN